MHKTISFGNAKYAICGDGVCLLETIFGKHDHFAINTNVYLNSNKHQVVGFSPDLVVNHVKSISFDESSEISSVPIELIKGCSSTFTLPKKTKRVFCFNSYSDSRYFPKIVAEQSENKFISAAEGKLIINHFPPELAYYKTFRHRVFIRETIQSIGGLSFCANRTIQTVVVPSSVEEIGFFAFNGCCNLRLIIFKKNSRLKKIGIYSFYNSGIEKVHLPSSLEIIMKGAFAYCYKLRSVTFEDVSMLKKLGEISFESTILESITIPSNVEEIEAMAFSICKRLKSVIFAENSKLKKIDEYAFRFAGLESIDIPSSVEEIGKRAFLNCENLVSVTYQDKTHITKFGEDSFFNCTNLEDK